MMLQILERFGSPVGRMGYMSLRNSIQWFTFQALAAQLGADQRRNEIQRAFEAMSENDRKAFFINLHNVMTFHGVTQYGRKPGSCYQWFFITPMVSYIVGNTRLSLDQIENGILRAQPGYFSDPRQSASLWLRMPKVDPRIHMALNCGAMSCPSVAVYSGANLDADLDDAVAAFVADDANVLLKIEAYIPGHADFAGPMGEEVLRPVVSVSEVFKMYTVDFLGETVLDTQCSTRSDAIAIGLLQWVIPFMSGEKKSMAEHCLQLFQQSTPGALFMWLPYNWETNGELPSIGSNIYMPRAPFTNRLSR